MNKIVYADDVLIAFCGECEHRTLPFESEPCSICDVRAKILNTRSIQQHRSKYPSGYT